MATPGDYQETVFPLNGSSEPVLLPQRPRNPPVLPPKYVHLSQHSVAHIPLTPFHELHCWGIEIIFFNPNPPLTKQNFQVTEYKYECWLDLNYTELLFNMFSPLEWKLPEGVFFPSEVQPSSKPVPHTCLPIPTCVPEMVSPPSCGL